MVTKGGENLQRLYNYKTIIQPWLLQRCGIACYITIHLTCQDLQA